MNLSITSFKNLSFLKSCQIHIWRAYFPDNFKHISYYESILSDEEQQRMKGFRFPIDKQKYIVSRGILRSILGIYLKTDSRNIDILYGPWGKPYLSSKSQLYFNLSHSRDFVIYAFSPTSEIGIDLEFIDSSLDINSLAAAILSPCELTYWRETSDEDKIHSFFRLWVCKEAFLKTSGKGFLDNNYDLPEHLIDFLRVGKVKNPENDKFLPYLFKDIPNYVGAVFVEEAQNIEPVHFTWAHHKFVSLCKII